MQYPIDAGTIYDVNNIVPWVKQGTSYIVGGSFAIVSGAPAIKLAVSTNTTLGYGNGQMLATASGVKSDTTASGLTAGAIYNVDASSLDTGQQVWNGMIICDSDLHQYLDVDTTTLGTLQVATPETGWIIRQQYLYCSGTPATDATLVTNQLNNYATLASGTGAKGTLSRSQVMNASGAYEYVFAY